MAIKSSKKSKSPPILSHEFIIQNHGDIVSCVAMVIVIGLLFQATSALASIFLIVQHSIQPSEDSGPEYVFQYTNGTYDFATIFFYGLITIVIHAIVQDYVLDKINRKLHLSKTKHSKFNEAGQLLVFELFAVAWGLHIIFQDESFTGFSSLWANYPEQQSLMTFRLKFFFIVQVSYWLHTYPELYFLKVKKEEIKDRVIYATLHLVLISLAYYVNLTRLTLVLLVLHYVCEGLLHASKLLYYAEMFKQSKQGFSVYNVLFVVLRLVSLILAIVTIQFGLGSSDNQTFDLEAGNFNTSLFRTLALGAVCSMQGVMLWNYLTYHMRKRREKHAEAAAAQKKKQQQQQAKVAARKSKRGSDDDVSSLPEVDQNTRRRR